MTLEEMKKIKQEHGYSISYIAEHSGVPTGTLAKLFSGQTGSPRRATVAALEKFFSDTVKKEKRRLIYSSDSPGLSGNMVREDPAPYGTSAVKKEKHTIDDYYALPDDVRVELIDGVFYDMAAPTYVHQELIALLAFQLRDCVKKHDMPCRVFFSPCDVQLDKDRYTMVQPDILVICDPEKLKERVLFGAPDLAIEVLSRSTRIKDLTLKTGKYRAAGVREYWVVDPDSEQVVVYCFEEDDIPQIFDRESTIPVHISKGLCSIDLGEIWKEIDALKNWG